ncbi:MAG: hypothetical protein WC595_00340 [Candidatus Nanoarchaeia archaeon]
MDKKGEDYSFYSKALINSFKILKHPRVYIPDLLLFLISIGVLIGYLALNNLLSPLFQINKAAAFSGAIKTLVQSTPSLLRFIISTSVLVFLHLIFGISLISTRFVLLKYYLQGKTIDFIPALKEGQRYFWNVFFIKLFLFFLYLIPLTLFFTLILFTKKESILPFVFTILALLWLIIKALALFSYPILYLEQKSVRAVLTSFKYALAKMKHVVLTLLFLTIISFFLNLFLTLIPQAWIALAVATNLLSTIAIFSLIYLLLLRISTIIYSIFESAFLFETYKK